MVNVVFKNQLRWSKCDALLQIMERFKDFSRLPRIQGAIDVVSIHIDKSRIQTFVAEYYSYKSKAYNMQL